MSALPRAVLLLAWLAPLSAVAGSDENLRSCRAIALDAERLACYDRVADRLLRSLAASPEGGSPKPPALAAGAPKGSAADSPERPVVAFGRSDTSSARDLRDALGVEEAREIRSDVASVSVTADRKRVIGLANGQTWLQKDTAPISLRVGDLVVVQKGALGAYYLRRASGGRMIAVRLVEAAR
jgi:hypothetical protein